MDRRMLLGGLAGTMLLAPAIALSVGNWQLAVVLLGAFVIWFVRSGAIRR